MNTLETIKKHTNIASIKNPQDITSYAITRNSTEYYSSYNLFLFKEGDYGIYEIYTKEIKDLKTLEKITSELTIDKEDAVEKLTTYILSNLIYYYDQDKKELKITYYHKKHGEHEVDTVNLNEEENEDETYQMIHDHLLYYATEIAYEKAYPEGYYFKSAYHYTALNGQEMRFFNML